MTRLGFPITRWDERRLGGNVFYAVGQKLLRKWIRSGNFFAYLRRRFALQLTAREDVTGFAAYQKRTQDRRQTSFGFTYGFRF